MGTTRLRRACVCLLSAALLAGVAAGTVGASVHLDGARQVSRPWEPPTRSTGSRLAEKRYAAAGDRSYIVGTTNGSFPPMGWHITGQMGGVWAHPLKLLDGYWFRLAGRWLTDAKRFTSGLGYARLDFPAVDGIRVSRTEFAPDGMPVALVGLRLRNPGASSRQMDLRAVLRSEIMAAYPWGSSQPEDAGAFNRPDHAAYDGKRGIVSFREPGKPWYALAASSVTPHDVGLGGDLWGPVTSADQGTYDQYGKGTGARLDWRLKVPARGDLTLWLAIAGSHTAKSEALHALGAALADPERLLKRKIAWRSRLWKRTAVELPDPRLQSAFDWGKMNLADLRRTVTDVHVRATNDGTAYPKPVKTLPMVSGIGAGLPDYPWFFGADGAYTTYALIASGQWTTAMDHLRAIRDFSRAINGKTGKVVHEVVTDGSVYFGSNADLGDTNETAQVAIGVDLLWRWSGSRSFLRQMYPFLRDGMRYITSKSLDPDGDGWPEGLGMVERSGMASATLDVAAYTVAALHALTGMARAMGDRKTADWARARAAGLAGRFTKDWWVAKDSLYADSMCSVGDALFDLAGCHREYQKVQQRCWTDATPMEMALAPAGDAAKSLNRLQSSTFTGRYGLYHTGKGGGSDGNGELAIWTLPNSVMAVAESNYGRVDRALFYMDAIARLLDMEQPGALPEIAPSPAYNPFQPLTSRAMFMQAWSSYGVQWPVIHEFLGIVPDIPDGRLSVIPDLPAAWPSAAVSKLRVGRSTMSANVRRETNGFTLSVAAPKGLKLLLGLVIPSGHHATTVRLDGRTVSFHLRHTLRGSEVQVSTTSGRSRTLEVYIAKGPPAG